MTSQTTTHIELITCWMCHTPIMAELAVEFSPPKDLKPDAEGVVNLTASAMGMRVSHDCIPKVMRTRGGGEVPEQPTPDPDYPPTQIATPMRESAQKLGFRYNGHGYWRTDI